MFYVSKVIMANAAHVPTVQQPHKRAGREKEMQFLLPIKKGGSFFTVGPWHEAITTEYDHA